MVRLAIQGNDHFQLSLEEMHEEGYTYTKETLTRLTGAHPDTDYFFIMGADSLFEFDTWRCPDEIARLCTLIVAVRDGHSSSELDSRIDELRARYRANIRKLTSPNLDISSHMIRDGFPRETASGIMSLIRCGRTSWKTESTDAVRFHKDRTQTQEGTG